MEKKMKRAGNIVSLVLDLLVFVMEAVAFCFTWGRRGTGMFIYFTELSNIFAGIVCAVAAAFIIREMITGYTVPSWVKLLKYVAACGLALTFFTVLFVLAPMSGGTPKIYLAYLTMQTAIVTHTLGPILTMVSLIFADDFKTDKFSVSLFGLVPTVLYEILSVTMNVLRRWEGPYPFLYVYRQPVWASIGWALVMLGFSYLLCLGIWFSKKAVSKKQK